MRNVGSITAVSWEHTRPVAVVRLSGHRYLEGGLLAGGRSTDEHLGPVTARSPNRSRKVIMKTLLGRSRTVSASCARVASDQQENAHLQTTIHRAER